MGCFKTTTALIFLLAAALMVVPIPAPAAPGDIDGDRDVDLTDAMISIRAAAGAAAPSGIRLDGDVNGAGAIGVEEASHALRMAAGFPMTVNSPGDSPDPPPGSLTLRDALEIAAPGQPIVFDPSLDGGTVSLSIVGETHTTLRGEVMGMRMEPSGPVSYLVGYFDRDYGASALYARKDVVLDASALPAGITLEWTGGAADPARVLAVYGDLTLRNVTVTGGYSKAEALPVNEPDDQPWTLARGAGVAVWGRARLHGCKLYDNHCEGDFEASRDRGAFGGGLYANIVEMADCVVAGNTVLGAGAAGGGIYSVGGAEIVSRWSTIERCAVTGNRIQGIFAYGAGVYSDGGGIGNRKYLKLTNTTVAKNLAEPPPGQPAFLLGMGYWRGGGIYMSNGYLHLQNCTVAENRVRGVARTDELGKPNLAGGIAATIGNAHAVEEMVIGGSIVTGNTVHEIAADGGLVRSYGHDIFTGSLLYFRSRGYNRLGVLDFSQILVPVGEKEWRSLCRKHYPKAGDRDGVFPADVLTLPAAAPADGILSAGVDAGSPAVRHYRPKGDALDRLPASHAVGEIYAEYEILDTGPDNFPEILLGRIEGRYGFAGFAGEVAAAFETFLRTVDADPDSEGRQPYTDPDGDPIQTLAEAQWFGPNQTWPSNTANYPYILFWRRLDDALRARNIAGMEPELLGDDVWSALFSSGPLAENPNIVLTLFPGELFSGLPEVDQLGTPRPAGALGDIGAVESP